MSSPLSASAMRVKRCPITSELFEEPGDYSPAGLRLLNPKLKRLRRLPFTAKEQREESLARAGKMSIQGVQLKVSAVLNVKAGQIQLVDRGGRFILKPQATDYPELPENEAITMRLAAAAGLEAPLHGLFLSADGSRTYFIKRFDRSGSARVSLEDFAQLSGKSRDTKYEASMEQIADVINRYCTFPAVERLKLFERTVFSFLTGNEDMHLKNFSLIARGGKITLSPLYDLVNTTIVLPQVKEELALPVNGKKRKIKREDLIDYFALERLQLQPKSVAKSLQTLRAAWPLWKKLLEGSFLSSKRRHAYLAVLEERTNRMGWSRGESETPPRRNG